mmetsp:Transcript_16408/g.46993  ORF Transcript_16408/g.46993 Transcript_16408/m.46993 type:complete len:293 (-) Transcript_16408:308-1186(-)
MQTLHLTCVEGQLGVHQLCAQLLDLSKHVQLDRSQTWELAVVSDNPLGRDVHRQRPSVGFEPRDLRADSDTATGSTRHGKVRAVQNPVCCDCVRHLFQATVHRLELFFLSLALASMVLELCLQVGDLVAQLQALGLRCRVAMLQLPRQGPLSVELGLQLILPDGKLCDLAQRSLSERPLSGIFAAVRALLRELGQADAELAILAFQLGGFLNEGPVVGLELGQLEVVLLGEDMDAVPSIAVRSQGRLGPQFGSHGRLRPHRRGRSQRRRGTVRSGGPLRSFRRMSAWRHPLR